MKEIKQSLLVGICLPSLMAAQNLTPIRDTRPSMTDFELFVRSFENDHAAVESEVAKRRQAAFLERQLLERMNRIVQVWTRFAQEYNARKTFNVKNARELSQAFHDLEKTEGWPKPEHTR
jgi:hypothetical protein